MSSINEGSDKNPINIINIFQLSYFNCTSTTNNIKIDFARESYDSIEDNNNYNKNNNSFDSQENDIIQHIRSKSPFDNEDYDEVEVII